MSSIKPGLIYKFADDECTVYYRACGEYGYEELSINNE